MAKKVKQKQKEPKEQMEHLALAVTRAVGSLESVILHTLLFVGSFLLVQFGVLPFERMLLILTTIVSLEAIYLSIFIQMTINYTTRTIENVEQDIEEIQEDIDEIQEDVDEIQEDVDEIQENVDEIQEDVEEMTEDEKAEEASQAGQEKTLDEIRSGLQKLMQDVEKLHNRP
jgi:uncharacterized protein YoxC